DGCPAFPIACGISGGPPGVSRAAALRGLAPKLADSPRTAGAGAGHAVLVMGHRESAAAVRPRDRFRRPALRRHGLRSPAGDRASAGAFPPPPGTAPPPAPARPGP